ncbi:hypothetical protein ACFX2C_018960 [Malus domestica]
MQGCKPPGQQPAMAQPIPSPCLQLASSPQAGAVGSNFETQHTSTLTTSSPRLHDGLQPILTLQVTMFNGLKLVADTNWLRFN